MKRRYRAPILIVISGMLMLYPFSPRYYIYHCQKSATLILFAASHICLKRSSLKFMGAPSMACRVLMVVPSSSQPARGRSRSMSRRSMVKAPIFDDVRRKHFIQPRTARMPQKAGITCRGGGIKIGLMGIDDAARRRQAGRLTP